MSLQGFSMAALPHAMTSIPPFHKIDGTHTLGTQGAPHPMGKMGRPTAPRVPRGPPAFGSGPPSVNINQIGPDGPLSKPTASVFVTDEFSPGLENRVSELFPHGSLVFLPFAIDNCGGTLRRGLTRQERDECTVDIGPHMRKSGRPFTRRGDSPYAAVGCDPEERTVSSSLRSLDTVRGSNRCQGPAQAGWQVNLKLRAFFSRIFRAHTEHNVAAGVQDYAEQAVVSIPTPNELMSLFSFLGGCLCYGLDTRGQFVAPQSASDNGQKIVQVQIQKITRLLNVFMVTDHTQKTRPSDAVYLMVVTEDVADFRGDASSVFVGIFGICDNGTAPIRGCREDNRETHNAKGPKWHEVISLFRNEPVPGYRSSAPKRIGYVQHPPECQTHQRSFNEEVHRYWMQHMNCDASGEYFQSTDAQRARQVSLDDGSGNAFKQTLRHVAVDLR